MIIPRSSGGATPSRPRAHPRLAVARLTVHVRRGTFTAQVTAPGGREGARRASTLQEAVRQGLKSTGTSSR